MNMGGRQLSETQWYQVYKMIESDLLQLAKEKEEIIAQYKSPQNAYGTFTGQQVQVPLEVGRKVELIEMQENILKQMFSNAYQANRVQHYWRVVNETISEEDVTDGTEEDSRDEQAR
jgi:hypothetical protein